MTQLSLPWECTALRSTSPTTSSSLWPAQDTLPPVVSGLCVFELKVGALRASLPSIWDHLPPHQWALGDLPFHPVFYGPLSCPLGWELLLCCLSFPHWLIHFMFVRLPQWLHSLHLISYIQWGKTGLYTAETHKTPALSSCSPLVLPAFTSHYFCFKHSVMLERGLNNVTYLHPHNCQAQCSSLLCWLRLLLESLPLSWQLLFIFLIIQVWWCWTLMFYMSLTQFHFLKRFIYLI